MRARSPLDLAPVVGIDDYDDEDIIVDAVQHPVVSRSDAPLRSGNKPLRRWRTSILREEFHDGLDSAFRFRRKLPDSSDSGW